LSSRFLAFFLGVTQEQHVRKICENMAVLLRKERERKKLSLSAVARRAGLSYQMIALVERLGRNPTVDSFIRIAEALELDPAKVLARAVNGAKMR